MASAFAMDMLIPVQSIMLLDCTNVTVQMEHVGSIVNNVVHCLTMPHTLDTELVVMVSLLYIYM